MLALMPSDVACSYTTPSAHPITLRAAPDAGTELITIGSTGTAARLVITAKGSPFMELTGQRLRARGYPGSDELVAARTLPFGELVVIPRAETVKPVSGSRGKLVIAPPVLAELRFVTPPAPAEVPCDALTMDEVVMDATQDAVIGSVIVGQRPRELFATPGGPAIATTALEHDQANEGRTFEVVGQKRGYFRVVVSDGKGRVVAWMKDTGLKLIPLAKTLEKLQMDMLAALSAGPSGTVGMLSSGSVVGQGKSVPEILGRPVICMGTITILASRIAGGAVRIPILTLKDAGLYVGERRGQDEYVPVTIASPRDITPAQGAILEARAADVDACSAPP